MLFKCSVEEFSNAIQTVERGVAQRSTIPVLSNIYLEARSDHTLILAANSLDMGIQVELKAEVKKPGRVLAPSKIISGIATKLPHGELTFESSPQHHIRVEAASSKFVVHGLGAEEFPQLVLPKQPTRCELPSATLVSMLRQTIFAVSTDESKPFLNGILFEGSENGLKLVATDGYRLALRSEQLPLRDKFKVIIPSRAVNEALKLILAYPDEEHVVIELSSDLVVFKVAQVVVVSRLIQGQFPDYQLVIPAQSDTKISLPRRVFQESAERCSVVASRSNNIIVLELSEDHLLLSANTPEVGDASEMVKVEVKGINKNKISFNVRLLLEILKNMPEGDIQLELSRRLSPGVLRPKGQENQFLYIIMPIKTAEPVEAERELVTA